MEGLSGTVKAVGNKRNGMEELDLLDGDSKAGIQADGNKESIA